MKHYSNTLLDIEKLISGSNIIYINELKHMENNFITGFNYYNNTTNNITSNPINESEMKFTCIFDDVINKLLELMKSKKFLLAISLGLIDKIKFHEVILDRIFEKDFDKNNYDTSINLEKNESKERKENIILPTFLKEKGSNFHKMYKLSKTAEYSGKFISSIKLQNGLTAHIFNEKRELQSILKVALDYYKKIKDHYLYKKLEVDKIYGQFNETLSNLVVIPISFLVQITIIPVEQYSLYEIKKNLKYCSHFTFIDSLIGYNSFVDNIINHVALKTSNKKVESIAKIPIIKIIESDKPSIYKIFFRLKSVGIKIVSYLIQLNKAEKFTLSNIYHNKKNKKAKSEIKSMSQYLRHLFSNSKKSDIEESDSYLPSNMQESFGDYTGGKKFNIQKNRKVESLTFDITDKISILNKVQSFTHKTNRIKLNNISSGEIQNKNIIEQFPDISINQLSLNNQEKNDQTSKYSNNKSNNNNQKSIINPKRNQKLISSLVKEKDKANIWKVEYFRALKPNSNFQSLFPLNTKFNKKN